MESTETILKPYKIHPAACLFPMMTEAELSELSEDIRKSGLIHPIITYRGEILDGRNRLVACRHAGVVADFEEWKPNGCSPTAWVMSANLKRRNLTPSQKAAIATEALPLFEAEAAQRKKELSGTRSNPGVKKEVPEKIPGPERADARDHAAAAVGVNPRYVSDAKAIKESAPEVFEKVKSGEMSIPEAKRTLSKPRRRGSYEDWKAFRDKCRSIDADLKELRNLKVDAQNISNAWRLLDEISKTLQKTITTLQN